MTIFRIYILHVQMIPFTIQIPHVLKHMQTHYLAEHVLKHLAEHVLKHHADSLPWRVGRCALMSHSSLIFAKSTMVEDKVLKSSLVSVSSTCACVRACVRACERASVRVCVLTYVACVRVCVLTYVCCRC
jgi:hypothetical protein